jgi:hypothetical protein
VAATQRLEVEMSAQPASEHGPKYFVNIEGAEKPWPESEITVPEIRELAGWDPGQQILEVNLDENSERTLDENETVRLKPGHGFAKKIKFQRG